MFTSALFVKRLLYPNQMKMLISSEPLLNDLTPSPYTKEMFKENLLKRPAVEICNSFRVFARAQWPWMSALCYHPNVSTTEGTDAGLQAQELLGKEQHEELTTKSKELEETRKKEHDENITKRDVLRGQNDALRALLELMEHAMEKKKSEIDLKDKRLIQIAGEVILTAGKRDNARFVLHNFQDQLQSLHKHLKGKKEEHQKKVDVLDKDILELEARLETTRDPSLHDID